MRESFPPAMFPVKAAFLLWICREPAISDYSPSQIKHLRDGCVYRALPVANSQSKRLKATINRQPGWVRSKGITPFLRGLPGMRLNIPGAWLPKGKIKAVLFSRQNRQDHMFGAWPHATYPIGLYSCRVAE